MNELNLTNEWDKVFPKSEKVDHKKVTFTNRYGSGERIRTGANRNRSSVLASNNSSSSVLKKILPSFLRKVL
mgnify:CR=1 FL=1